ncbi:MAG: hypothetical protein ACYCVH_06795 [Ignavibacteriaceae bacterium]
MIFLKNTLVIANLIIIFLIFSNKIKAQQDGAFYFNGNVNQEYSNNFLRLPDTANSNDFRLLSSVIIGYNWNNNSLDGNFDISYENRYLYYFQLKNYRRLEHYFSFDGSVRIDTNNILFLYNITSIRNYEKLKPDNYFRNIFNIYDQMKLMHHLRFLIGYNNWIKNYPNSSLFHNYFSHRAFIKTNYLLNTNDYIGLKLEYQYHRGNLYPVFSLNNTIGDLSGSRYYVEVYLTKLWGRKFITDFSYKFESDQPNNNSNNQGQNNYQSDESIEDLLIDDADFDYLKNQFNVSLLVKISDKLSLFSFNVFQFKNFNSWIVNSNEDLRKDILVYNSLMLKYKLAHSLRLNIFFNLENNNSNLNWAKYNSYKIGIGCQFEF